MRFASLGSGSKGNANLVEVDGCCLLFDFGFSLQQTQLRLAKLGKSIKDIDAVFLSHEHQDHIAGVCSLAQNTDIPLWASPGTARHLPDVRNINHLDLNSSCQIKDTLEITPVTVPYDADSPCQFVINSGTCKLGILTDAGHITSHIEKYFSGLDALMLETNYDEEMLINGTYPGFLKQRISGRLGHLSNRQSAGLLSRINSNRLKHVVLMHISEKNNCPELAANFILDAIEDKDFSLGISNQNEGLPWVEI